MIEILFVVNIIFFLIQFLLGLLAWTIRNYRSKKYAFPTSEQLEPAKLVEQYFYDPEYTFEIRAADDIDEPAEADENYLWVHRKKLNHTDLYTNFYLIYQAELTSDKHKFLRIYNSLLGTLFFFHFVIAVVAIIIRGDIGIVVLTLSILFNSVYAILWLIAYMNQSKALDKSYLIADAVMKFDDVEKARAKALVNDLRYELLEYPWEIFWRLWVFFTP